MARTIRRILLTVFMQFGRILSPRTRSGWQPPTRDPNDLDSM